MRSPPSRSSVKKRPKLVVPPARLGSSPPPRLPALNPLNALRPDSTSLLAPADPAGESARPPRRPLAVLLLKLPPPLLPRRRRPSPPAGPVATSRLISVLARALRPLLPPPTALPPSAISPVMPAKPPPSLPLAHRPPAPTSPRRAVAAVNGCLAGSSSRTSKYIF